MPTLFAPMEDLLSPTTPVTPTAFLDQPRHAARLLAWISGVLAIPGAFAAFAGWFLIVPPVLFIIGCVLLAGYIRAARVSAENPGPGGVFWRWSIAYNALLLLPTMGILIANLSEMAPGLLVVLGLAAWQASAVHLSLRALRVRQQFESRACMPARPAGS